MKVRMIILILALLLTLFSTQAGAQTKVGTTAAPFLGIAVGPRAIGSGGAFVAQADDATALYWNNAGIAQLTMSEIIVSHDEWIAGMSFDYVGAVFNIGSGAFGMSFTSLSMDEMEVTTVLDPEGNGERFDAGSVAVGLTYAYALTDRFYIGGTAKYIREYIWKESAHSFACDLGTLYVTEFFNGMRIGAVITNFGSSMEMEGDDLVFQHDIDENQDGNNDNTLGSWMTDSWTLPINFRVGMAVELMQTDMHRVTMMTDVTHPNDNEESMNLGGEYAYKNTFFLRAGYKSLFLGKSEEGITCGAGFLVSQFGSAQMGVDYAFQDFGRLEDTHTLSLRMRF